MSLGLTACLLVAGGPGLETQTIEADEARCAAALQSLLAERRKEITLLPTVSLGSAVFSGEDVVTVKDRADRALYCAKNELKARAAAAMPAGGSGEKD